MAPQMKSALKQTNNIDNKRIVFIRHGRTYMNEYLATPGTKWGDPNFTDVFHKDIQHLYKDSPLSPKGVEQAQKLAETIDTTVAGEIDMVIVSPLTRSLQTMEIALLPHLSSIPIVAQPLATERVYLISDIGKPPSQLIEDFRFVDFETAIRDEKWWFHQATNHKEWRPNSNGQRYACKGEPQEYFENRMTNLYKMLEQRPERTIALVTHWGVIDWMLGQSFANCEMRVVPFDEIQKRFESDSPG